MASAVVEAPQTDEQTEQTDEVQTQTEQTTEQPENSENGTGRKRVDITTLDPNAKVVLSLHIPAGLKIKIRQAGENATGGAVSEAQLVRDLLAKHFEYEIPESFSERRGRTSQYAGMSEEEIKEAKKRENAEKRGTVTSLVDAVKAASGEDPEFAAKLAALGVDLSKLPQPRKSRKSEDS